jgi:hypothetical protein
MISLSGFGFGAGGFSFGGSIGAGLQWFLQTGIWKDSGVWKDSAETIAAPLASNDFLATNFWDDDGNWDELAGDIVE